MNYCILEVVSETATFRDPEFQNFHRTYRLPPPSTLVGVAGAALGKSAKAAQDYFLEESWQFGIRGTSEAVFNDLWKYHTLKKDENKRTSILTREILFRSSFVFVFGSENLQAVQELTAAFTNPVYALTAGNSDSLLKIKKVSMSEAEHQKSQSVAHCWVQGDVLQMVLADAKTGDNFSIYTSSEPTLFDLPMQFEYKSEYGQRSIRSRRQFSFVGEPMRLNYAVTGIQHKDQFIPLFSYAD